jgi:uncharacterized membrane protein YeaQ/YmgE (transglycosylase-associated protein family)
MGILAWIVLGAIAGFVANLLVGGGEGLIKTIILGIVGGLLGGFVATTVFHTGSMNALNLESILIATAGAVAVLVVWRAVTPRRRLHL